jgi:hypothetical protein
VHAVPVGGNTVKDSAAGCRCRIARPAIVLAVLAAASPGSLHAQVPAAAADDRLHRVAPGDTLIALARSHLDPAHGWRGLQRLNGVTEPRRLQPGRILRFPLVWLKAEPALAEVLHVRGAVTFERAGAGALAVVLGVPLQAGDLLRAGPESSLTLRFADGARLLLRSDSTLRLTRLLQRPAGGGADTGLRLDQGSADSRVPPLTPQQSAGSAARRYEVTTPTVHLGVRGTEFRTRVDAGDATTHVEVIEGQVAAGSGSDSGSSTSSGQRAEQRLAAGQGAVAVRGARALAAAALAPPPDLTTVSQRVERVPLRLAWAPRDGVRSWHAQVVDPEHPDRLLLDGRFDNAAARWTDLPDGRYELRVRAVDPAGLEGLDARRPFVLKARPFPPFIAQPRSGATLRGEGVRFGWTVAADIASYHLQVVPLEPERDAAAADFAKPLADRLNLTAPAHDEVLPAGRYAWRIASVRSDGDQGPFGDVVSFTLRPLPAAPVLQEPQVSDNALVLRWPAGEPGDRYELQLAADASFNAPLHAIETREPEAVLPRPGPGRYFVRVRSIDTDGIAGPHGEAQQVDVPHSRWWWLLPAGLLLLGL